MFFSKLQVDCSAADHMINQDFLNATVKHSDSKILSFTSSWSWSFTLWLKIKSNLNNL